MALLITRQDENAADLRRMARLSRNVAQARRLLAIASVMDGHSRTVAATGPAWTGNRCATGFTGSTRRARTVLSTSLAAAVLLD